MITRFYYTFDELQEGSTHIGAFANLLNYWSVVYVDTSYTTSLYNHITEEYGDDFIVYIDIEHPTWQEVSRPTIAQIKADAELTRQVHRLLNKVKGWLDDSRFRFEKLIELFEAEKTHLLDQVKSSSTTQFNDTPQTTITGLDSDNYASTYTKVNSSSDFTTVMGRLNEIRNTWNSLYAEWVEEFAKKFVLYL